MQQNFDKSFRINDQIKVKEVRVVDENGGMVGIIPIEKALELADKSGLDLVEVSPNVVPPVCKIANFGKMKYEMQKKANDSKKKQKTIEIKEVKLSVNIGKGDFDVKMKQILKFIEKGCKVKISLKIKGREITHLELVDQMMVDVTNQVSDHAKFELAPRLEGKQMVAVLVKK